MPGGTWVTQNKVRPGVYINIVSDPKSLSSLGERGTVALPLMLPWGAAKQIITINAGDDVSKVLGYDITHPSLLLVKEALKRASKLLVYKLNEGTKATVTSGNLVITAKYGGVRGNDISIVIQADIDTPSNFNVRTLVEGREVETQKVTNIDGLVANDWVSFKAAATDKTLAATAGAPLTGGANGTVTNTDHNDFLTAVETQSFNTIGVVSTDPTLKSVYVSFVKRLRESEGRYVQVVLSDYPTADYEGVISTRNGVVLSDGTVIDKVNVVAWVAAATAAALVNQSLTYTAYDDAVDVDVRLTNSETVAALQNGEFVFSFSNDRAIVEQDINTFRSYVPKKGKERSKNRVIRVLDSIGNDLKKVFENSYIGKVDNNVDGRNIFKKEGISYMELLQSINAIEDFNSQTDFVVTAGEDKDAVLVNTGVKPVDAAEKIYLEVRVR
ncbi:phage tail sheath family protein [Paenibacillus polymyxa]|uniref:phage tail sheath family protein n=1 Tax=Paenibacillus polymyxa TaxID=1406 RepID=UPI000737CB87|nr:phage tail sheath family protein [Paenibacillus polymyxa]